VKERLVECSQNAEALVARLLELAEQLGAQAGHGGGAHPLVDRALELAMTLRSDLRRLVKYVDALDP
jgi:hypothetical protein